jgi:hypothetical protein
VLRRQLLPLRRLGLDPQPAAVDAHDTVGLSSSERDEDRIPDDLLGEHRVEARLEAFLLTFCSYRLPSLRSMQRPVRGRGLPCIDEEVLVRTTFERDGGLDVGDETTRQVRGADQRADRVAFLAT